MELHTIELRKFSDKLKEEVKDLKDLIGKIKTSLDMWVAFLTRHDLMNQYNLSAELKDKDLQKALTVLEVMNFSSEEREAYEDHLKWLRIEANTLKKAEDKGRAEGRAEGIVKGFEQGIEKGIEKIARNMVAKGKSIEEIMDITGLSKEQIEKLI